MAIAKAPKIGKYHGKYWYHQISSNIIRYQEGHHALGFVKFDLKLKRVKVIQSRHSCHKPMSSLQWSERRLFEKPGPQRFLTLREDHLSALHLLHIWSGNVRNLGIFGNIWEFSLFDRFARTCQNIPAMLSLVFTLI